MQQCAHCKEHEGGIICEMTTKISEFASVRGLVCRSGEDAKQRRWVRFGRRTRGFCQEAEAQRVSLAESAPRPVSTMQTGEMK